MAEVSICYGMTETSPVSLQTRRDDDLGAAPAPSAASCRTSRSRSSTRSPGVTLPRGEGRRAVHPRLQRDARLLGEPRRSAEVVDAGRWMHTGDLAVLREDGYAQIVGRIKDMIIRGGENVYPREIEEFLYGHPRIADVQVVGVPHEKYGEEVLACVILRDPAGRSPSTTSATTAATSSPTTRCRPGCASSTRSR